MSAPEATTDAPPSRGHAWWAALAYAAATLTLGWPALLGRFLVNPRSDQYIAGYAFREFAAASLKSGQGFPEWNPYLFGGLPYVAAMHGDIFYPTFLLRLVMPTDMAMTWGFVLHLWLAGMMTYAFLRVAGVSFGGALVGGLAYLMCGPIASYASPGHDGKLFVSSLLPAVLVLLHLGIRGRKAWSWGALALVIGLAVLSPHPQLLEYLLLAGASYGIYLLRAHDASGQRLDARTAWLDTAKGIGAAAVGGLMGMVQFWPVKEYVSWSPRAAGGVSSGFEHAISYSFPPEELINTALPQFSGVLDNYWGRNGIHFHSEYLGIAVLALAGLAFGRSVRRSLTWYLTGLLVVSVLWALGGYTPFYQLIYAIVPGSKFFRAPSTIIFVSAFAMSALAALGAERLLKRDASLAWAVGWGIGGALLVLLAASGGLANFGNSVTGGQRYDVIQENAGELLSGAIRMAIFLAGVIGLGLAAARGLVKPAVATAALGVLVVADLWTVERLYWPFSDRASVLYASDATIDHIKQQKEPGRVLALNLGEGAAPRDPFLRGDALMTHRIRAVLGYHGNELGRYQKLYGADDGMRQLGNPNFWALSNARFLLTSASKPVFPGMTLAAGPVRNAAGSMVYLWKMPGDNPAAWVAPAIVKAPDEQALATVLDPRFDVHTVALFDSAAAVPSAALKELPKPLPLTVSAQTWEAGHISLTLSAPAPAGSALVVSENFYPGWRATVDGKAASAARADVSLIGVPLPAGATKVELTFRSDAVATGMLMTAIGCVLGLAWLAFGIVADRRPAGA
ncbi:MAG: YfhO family protein [Gemmatimonadetes bacterium]|nr:YfhO family protein [Gemmatimonadota bacterium]